MQVSHNTNFHPTVVFDSHDLHFDASTKRRREEARATAAEAPPVSGMPKPSFHPRR